MIEFIIYKSMIFLGTRGNKCSWFTSIPNHETKYREEWKERVFVNLNLIRE